MWAVVTVAAAITAGTDATALYPKPSALPPHDWASLSHRVFIHGCKREGLLNASELALAAKFPILTVEKGQGEDLPGYAEDKMAAMSKQYKAARPDGWSLFYMNLVHDWGMYRMHQRALTDPALTVTDIHGKPCRRKGDPTFPQPPNGMLMWNASNPNTRDLLISTCVNATTPAGGGFDGCFLDSATPWKAAGTGVADCDLGSARLQALHDGDVSLLLGMQAGVTDNRLVVAKEKGDYNDTQWVNTVFLSDTFCSCYSCTSWDSATSALCEQAIESAITIGQRGQVVFMHGEANQSPTPAAPDAHVFTFSLAAYLVAAYDTSFYGYSDGWYYNGTRWHEEYDRPLGSPLGDAVRTPSAKGSKYTRSFEHADVTVDVGAYTAAINWK